MGSYRKIIYRIALLFTGSAIFLFSCKKDTVQDAGNNANMVTQMVENLTVVDSREGELSVIIKTPLLESYDFAREPYTEFRKGVYLERYDDSTKTVEVTLTANYAIQIQSQDLWEAKGSVVVVNAKGDKLETEQLFWNRKTQRIYSNVDSRISNGTNVTYGSGFESDELMERWSFRDPRWDVDIPDDYGREDSGPGGAGGSTAAGQPTPEGSTAVTREDPDYPVIREGEAVAKPKQ